MLGKTVQVAKRLRGFDAPTVWGEFTPLAIQHKAVNLGQGFPDWETPQFIKDTLSRSVQGSGNQYARSAGDVRLVEALSKHYSPLVGRTIDPLNEIAVSVGATGVLYAVLQGALDEGDEVVVLEPAFDIYAAQIQLAGAVAVYVPLRVQQRPDGEEKWSLDMAELEAALSPRTKMIILNTPHNPTGKVFSLEELQSIAAIVLRHPGVTVVTDEVYEKLVYDEGAHVRLASLPGMWDRTLTVSSCGKTFSCTGWKIGWAYGAAHLVKPMVLTNQWVHYCVSTPTQVALAEVLRLAELPYEGFPSYYAFVRAEYQRKRDLLVAALRAAEFRPIVPEGGFFIVADTAAHEVPESFALPPGPSGVSPVSRDWALARWMTADIGVTPIPPSAFYTPERAGLAANLARFAFCKTDNTLAEGKRRLEVLGESVRLKKKNKTHSSSSAAQH